MNVLDLFSGIGGFSLGLERAGMRTVAFCEIDPYCRAVLRKHWPNVPIFEDIRTVAAYRSPEAGGSLVLRGRGIAGEAVSEIRGESSINVGHASPQDEIKGSNIRPPESNGSIKSAGEEECRTEEVSNKGKANNQNADFDGNGERQVVSDVLWSGGGHRSHYPGVKGRSNGTGKSPVALQGMSLREVPSGQKGGLSGSLQIVAPIDVICGGFP